MRKFYFRTRKLKIKARAMVMIVPLKTNHVGVIEQRNINGLELFIQRNHFLFTSDHSINFTLINLNLVMFTGGTHPTMEVDNFPPCL